MKEKAAVIVGFIFVITIAFTFSNTLWAQGAPPEVEEMLQSLGEGWTFLAPCEGEGCGYKQWNTPAEANNANDSSQAGDGQEDYNQAAMPQEQSNVSTSTLPTDSMDHPLDTVEQMDSGIDLGSGWEFISSIFNGGFGDYLDNWYQEQQSSDSPGSWLWKLIDIISELLGGLF
jgi:hypothetical protein